MIEFIKLNPTHLQSETKDCRATGDIFAYNLQDNKDISKLLFDGITFKDGLNIVVGNCGVGKSVLQRAMSITLQAHQGGRYKKAFFTLRNLMVDNKFKRPNIISEFKHDDSCFICFDQTHEIGLVGGSFDDDFIGEGLQNLFAQNRSSHGQKSVNKIAKLVLGIVEGYKANKGNLDAVDYGSTDNTDIKKAVENGEYDECELPTSKPTIVIDEFETGLTLIAQYNILATIWKEIVETGIAQVIVFTHSPVILEYINNPDVNVIELSENYILENTKVLKHVMKKGELV